MMPEPLEKDNLAVTIVGGGLAGSEAAYQLAKRGIKVRLYEMRPNKYPPAHRTSKFAELVCSNSLGSDVLSSPAGILKAELRELDSLIIKCADQHKVPAGWALAVDREAFSEEVTSRIGSMPSVEIIRDEVEKIGGGPVIVASGPLTSPSLASDLKALVGEDFLYFYDAVAPVVLRDSINMEIAFYGSRYGYGEDYINCPLNEEEYQRFYEALIEGEVAMRHEFEEEHFFEGCLPVEVIAKRGRDALRYGPMRPVGLKDPRSGREPYAVVQLRQDDKEGRLYNIVGFQTNLRWSEQDRIFRLIPGLEEVEFARYGVMHRNIYVNAPVVLDEYLRLKGFEDLFFAGQLAGVEGYVESTAMGLVAALNVFCLLKGNALLSWPRETAIGSLLWYLNNANPKSFQPMNINLGLLPPLPKKIKDKRRRCEAIASKALESLRAFMEPRSDLF
ncbi:methylenetetrahydrofolate--tRNA-(uracil(54)-C(5))-methyltransferase (FADH(2)-oxidizing) TrmFO [Acetomicrobium hydrogeniformans]|uniref:Methylenetetrahydrofolate--tRNA-(uracil-5-)-methyltransferase TrmFO n=1 Tax=Acetomicrobium hydrogeniformans ATCC BAA-1850 TaxID=592015 RepID=A0A0T5XB42_9BACT|nr:methylenetetrahydrofolate--tRNA-(uracil(54)-C(5))-methyltransferase (FADH(2)-oxidizing) TrmFO [Acetomicrobium hydrogeniformans]KRT35595.1 tRNA:m(5)U-54 methyltransferase [Acetomicrobium hydrogeniformans ATCC BAA-1850]